MARDAAVDARLEEADALLEGALLDAADGRRRRDQRVAVADDDVRSDVLVPVALRRTCPKSSHSSTVFVHFLRATR